MTLKVVSESSVMWATFVPILVFPGLSVLELARCTRQTDVRPQTKASLNAFALYMGAEASIIIDTTSLGAAGLRVSEAR